MSMNQSLCTSKYPSTICDTLVIILPQSYYPDQDESADDNDVQSPRCSGFDEALTQR